MLNNYNKSIFGLFGGDSIMELKEFLVKFLSDYDKKRNVILQLERMKIGLYFDFISEHFPEALQNYTDRICEKQRENCIDAWVNTVGAYYTPNNIKTAYPQ